MSTKRILSLVLTLTLILGSFSFAFADHDKANLTTEQKIAELVRLGFVEGDELGDLNLDKKITRAETSTIVSKAVVSNGGEKTMEQVKKEIEKSRYQSRFPDVPVSYWANPYINVSVQEGIVVGYPDNTFKPANNITYTEVIVMMLNILGEKVDPSIGWPDNYIGKAREVGILKGLDNVVYTDEALRGGVFELLYNTLVKQEVGQYNIDKVIVLENNRVAPIGENQIVVEVIKEIQKANSVKDKAHRGEQIRLNVPKEIGEVENLLGKVVDVKYDAKNNAVHFDLDDSYQYVAGKITLGKETATVGDKTYTVLKGEQYKDSDERVYNTYVNNDAYTYEEAYKKFENKVDFGKVTIKNGRVVFVDAFAFEDIAPVKEINPTTGVIIYNDLNDGAEKAISLSDISKVLSLKDGKVAQMNKADIAANDVIHVAKDIKGNNVVVVKKDAKIEATFTKVVELKDKVVVQTADGKEYTILTKEGKRPVFSTDGVNFYTLRADQAASVLRNLRNEKVTILVDANDNLQLISGVQVLGEAAGLTERVVGNQARLIKKDNTKADYTANLNTKFDKLRVGQKTFTKMADLVKGDLVFVSSNKEALDRVTLLSESTEKGAVTEEVNSTNRYVRQGTNVYRVFDRTNVFVRNTDANGNVELFASTLANVAASKTADLKAVVITDEAFESVNPGYVYDKSANIAHTIVFNDVKIEKELNTSTAEVISISNGYEEIQVKYAYGEVKTFTINKATKAYDDIIGNTGNKRIMVGDIVRLSVAKNDATSLQEIERFIPVEEAGRRIESYNSRTKILKLVGDSNDYVVTDATDNFVKDGLVAGKDVAIRSLDAGGNTTTKFLEAVVERTAKAPVLGKGVLKEVIEREGKVVLKVTDVNGKDTLYQFIGTDAEVAAAKLLVGRQVNFDLQTLNNVEYAFNLKGVDAPEAPVTKAALAQAITDAKAVVTTGKTQASIDSLNAAIAAGEVIRDSVGMTEQNYRDAIATITKAIADLKDEPAVAWLETPQFFFGYVDGKVDVAKVKNVKAFVDGTELVGKTTIEPNGEFTVDAVAVELGKTIVVNAYDANGKIVNTKDVLRSI